MARLLWLADVLRGAGVQVVEVDGWRTRGREDWGPIRGVVYHATADKANSGPADQRDDAGAIAVIRDGRPGLSGPIAVAYVNREGVWHIIAAGRCNTVKVGWSGPLRGLGNSSIVGVEAENNNAGEDWPLVQLDSLRRGFAAILAKLGLPVWRLAAHWEHQPGEKTDPHGIDMGAFRTSVAAIGDDDMSVRASQLIEGLDGGFPTLPDGSPNNLVVRQIALEKWQAAVTVALKAIAERVDIDPAEMAAIEAAAQRGAQSAFDPQAVAVALAPVLAELLHVDQAAIVEALQSDAGQAALVRAHETAEDS
jgi:hypothetical protein